MEHFFYQTYDTALPIVLTALMGYVVWLLKNQKKDRDANSKGTMLLLRVQLIEYHDKYGKICREARNGDRAEESRTERRWLV